MLYLKPNRPCGLYNPMNAASCLTSTRGGVWHSCVLRSEKVNDRKDIFYSQQWRKQDRAVECSDKRIPITQRKLVNRKCSVACRSHEVTQDWYVFIQSHYATATKMHLKPAWHVPQIICPKPDRLNLHFDLLLMQVQGRVSSLPDTKNTVGFPACERE